MQPTTPSAPVDLPFPGALAGREVFGNHLRPSEEPKTATVVPSRLGQQRGSPTGIASNADSNPVPGGPSADAAEMPGACRVSSFPAGRKSAEFPARKSRNRR